MKKLILALSVCLIPHALFAQTISPTAAPPVRQSAASQTQAELAEAEKLSASVAQLYAAGNYKEALPLAQRVLALCEKVRGEEDPLVGSALNNLALIHIELKEFGKAEPILERILARTEKLKTATSPTTGSLLISYGCLMSAKGVGKRKQVLDLMKRINLIFLRDAVLAAGLPLPDDFSELNSRILSPRPQPRYPGAALSSRLQGIVLVWGETDETGKLVRVEPLPCPGTQKLLADAAAEAMRTTQFKPVLINGKPIKLKGIATYNFVIE
jgi:hypothetical protein